MAQFLTKHTLRSLFAQTLTDPRGAGRVLEGEVTSTGTGPGQPKAGQAQFHGLSIDAQRELDFLQGDAPDGRRPATLPGHAPQPNQTSILDLQGHLDTT